MQGWSWQDCLESLKRFLCSEFGSSAEFSLGWFRPYRHWQLCTGSSLKRVSGKGR